MTATVEGTFNPGEAENFMQLVASPQDYLKFRLNANLAGQPVKPAEAAWPEKDSHERNLLRIAAKDVT
jgi:hypothetical protein